jgi:hypothetical protein
MKVLFRLLFLSLLIGGSSIAAETDGRFTHGLSVEEIQETGVVRLSSDQIAVLDALVRRDLTARMNGRTEEAPKIFSDRLTVDERRIAGLDAISAAELARVNSLVERYQTIVVTRTLLSPPVLVSRHANMIPRETGKAERKIHGTFSMSLGWGSDGYSERTGSMEVHTELSPGLHLGVGYSVSRVKGEGLYYRDDPYYLRPPVVVAPPPPSRP